MVSTSKEDLQSFYLCKSGVKLVSSTKQQIKKVHISEICHLPLDCGCSAVSILCFTVLHYFSCAHVCSAFLQPIQMNHTIPNLPYENLPADGNLATATRFLSDMSITLEVV